MRNTRLLLFITACLWCGHFDVSAATTETAAPIRQLLAAIRQASAGS